MTNSERPTDQERIFTASALVKDRFFTEIPRWHEGKLYFLDMKPPMLPIAIIDPSAAGAPLEYVKEIPATGGFDFDASGTMVVVVDRGVGLALWNPGSEELERYADVSAVAPFGMGEIAVHPNGRVYAAKRGGGSPHTKTVSYHLEEAVPNGGVLVIDLDGSARVVAEDVIFPNCPTISADGRTLIVPESYGQRVSAWDIEADGSLSRRRIWADLPGTVPDGNCLDAEGALWQCLSDRPEVIRVHEGGRVSARVKLEAGLGAYACTLGGADGKTLFICTNLPVGELWDRRNEAE